MTVNTQLVELIKTHAVLRGNFTLRSGKTSKFYLDKYRLATQPKILDQVTTELARLIPTEVEILAGPELGAVALVAVLSQKLNKPFLIVRKESKDYGTAKRIEGVFTAGQKIVLVEDVLTTGGAVLSAAAVCREVGLDILGIVGILNRGKGAEENIRAAGIKLLGYLFTEADLGMVE